jgi:hypothetical protein
VFPHARISRNIHSSDYCRRRYYIDAGACKGSEVEALDFMAGLAALVPPPRIHQMRYHGVLAHETNRDASHSGTAMDIALRCEQQPLRGDRGPEHALSPQADPH